MIYLDTSAILRMIRSERWSDDLDVYLRGTDPGETFATSAVGVVEVHRVLLRDEADSVTDHRARELLDVFDRIDLTAGVIDTASRLAAKRLRTLDAIHVASALELGRLLTALVTYDQRMIDAARQAGLVATAPGMID